MKRILLLLLAGTLLTACSEDTTEEPKADVESAEEAPEESGPTQEELNATMKAEAIEIDFVEANGGGLAEGTKVKATGELSALDPSGLRGGDFMLSVKTDDGYGVYAVTNMNTVEIPLEEGQTVTVYGSFAGPEEGTNMPTILATIIE